MTLTAGTRIGPFEVVDLLGAGGMGAVYRAYDPRLRREVALKVLPPAFSRDPDRLRRFEQEALAVARLAHPNILAVHDIGTHDDAPYMVTELLEGETLRKKMTGQALPVRRAVDYAIQIGRGLAAAHEQGIVHRDIKPENVFVTRDGHLKVLDFGLAKLTDVDSVSGASAATLTVHSFGPLGTAAYMSPEQARGVRADHRADLFSVGVVLYEMLAGAAPFRRETAAEMMTAVLRDDPPDLPDAVGCPPALARILQHCLEKDPALRYQSARDLVFDLEGIVDALRSPARSGHQRLANPGVLAMVAAAVLAGVAAGGVALGRWIATPEPGVGVSGIHPLTDLSGLEEFPAMAPDLKSVAFTSRVDGHRQIFVRLLASGRPVQVTKDAVDHDEPRWSPDASSLVYFSPAVRGAVQGNLWEIPALGGAPRRIIESVGGGDVSSDGRIAAFRLADGHVELVTASADDSDVRVIARLTEPVYYRYPRWSPDQRRIAFQRGDGVRWDVFVVPVDGGDPRQLTHDNAQIHGLAWRPDSSGVVYSSSRRTTMAYLPSLTLWDVGLDGREPRRLVPADVSYLYPDGHASGAMVASRLHMQFDLWRFPLDGSPESNTRGAIRITRQTGQVQTPTVGASDREIAFLSDSGGHSNIWITSLETGDLRQITYERDPTVTLGVPIWSPDGAWIAFVSSRGDVGLGFGVWIVSPDGGNLRNVVPRGLGVAWSPDAQWIYYADAATAYKVSATGGPAVRVREGPVRNVVAFDGTTLYFMVDRTLTDGSPGFEIHAATPEDGPSRVLAHIPVSRAPQWQIINPSLSPDRQWLAMPLTDGATTNIWTLSTSTAQWRQITDFGDRATFIARRVSWSADGQSILAAVGEGDADIVALEMHPR
jgi:eukaryotic-like serine/threonine-protein kinase